MEEIMELVDAREAERLAQIPVESGGGSFVAFYTNSVFDEAASETAEVPIYKKVPYVKVIAPGNDKEIVDRRAKPEDKYRWPIEWARYEQGEKAEPDGVLIHNWPMITKDLADTFKANNIFTVEQLSKCADVNLQNLPMGVQLRYKALDWLKNQSTKMGKMKKENASLKRETTSLKKKFKVLEKRLKELEDGDVSGNREQDRDKSGTAGSDESDRE